LVTSHFRQQQARAFQALKRDKVAYCQEIRNIRQKALDNWEENLQSALENFRENGFIVHEADDAAAACRQIKEIIKGARRVVKSKTNTGHEINIEKAIKEIIGQQEIETDLGDFLVELLEAEELHYVLPALHITPQVISKKIKEKWGDDISADPTKLTRYLCDKIRKNILTAEVGITGANFFTKDGQVVLLENEGNISLISRLPQKHLIIVGIDKITESPEEAVSLCRAAALFGTGQKFTQYVSIISGPSKTADIQNQLVTGAQGAREVHIVLVNNGRRQMMEEGFGELLRCINCGACLNFCPVYRQLGRKYGSRYLGSKGVIFSAFNGKTNGKINMSFQAEREAKLQLAKKNGSFLCTLCGSCAQHCPMGIDLPGLMKKIRKKQQTAGLQTEENKAMLEKVKAEGNPFGKVKEKELPEKLFCC
jgi:L-lactate utilization protein LutB